MTFRGRIKDGMLVLNRPIELPEDTSVLVEIVADEQETIDPELSQWFGVLPRDINVDEEYMHGIIQKHS